MEKTRATDILRQLREVQLLVARSFRNALNSEGVTASQAMVILKLSEEGPLRLSDLSQKLGVTASTLSGVVDRLERDQWVSRRRITRDRREILIGLTDEAYHRLQALERRLEALLSAQDCDMIEQALVRMKQALLQPAQEEATYMNIQEKSRP
jgi:DNA-binding MarR family transcriptional regulator